MTAANPRSLLSKACLGLAPIVLAAHPLQASELKSQWVPRDTSWVFHLDVEAMLASKTFGVLERESKANADGEWDVDGWMEEGDFAELGLDPRKDLKSLTFFGSGEDPEDGVLVAETSASIDGALDKLREMEEWRSQQHGGFTLDAFGDGSDLGYVWVHHPEGAGHHVVFAAGSASRLVQAVRTFQGLEPSAVGRAEAPLDLSVRPGTFAMASVAMNLGGFDGLEDMAHLTRLVSGFHAAVGEDRYGMFVDLAAQTASSEDAANVRRIVDGVRALVSLAGDDVPMEVLDMLDMIRIDLKGSRVSLSFSIPVGELVDNLKSLEEMNF